MKCKIYFIVNPQAGKGNPGFADVLRKRIDDQKITFQVFEARVKDDIETFTCQAIEDQVDGVVVAGGDGSINGAGKHLINHDIALGIVPIGSGNGLARSMGLFLDVQACLDKIDAFNTKWIDAGWLNNEVFFNVAGIGFDAEVSRIYAAIPKGGIGAYAKAVLKAYWQSQPISVHSVYGNTKEAFMVSFANSHQFGNDFLINPKGILDDGKIEMVYVKPFSIWEALFLFQSIRSGKLQDSRLVEINSVSRSHVTTTKPVYYHLDGDIKEKATAFQLQVAPRVLKIIV